MEGRDIEREREKPRENLLSTVSLSKYVQQPGLARSEARVIHIAGRYPVLSASHTASQDVS